jgi:hypothetical protein
MFKVKVEKIDYKEKRKKIQRIYYIEKLIRKIKRRIFTGKKQFHFIVKT